jgi:DNA-binding Lrp family transcriptional regulator
VRLLEELLKILEKNARISLKELSTMVGASEEEVEKKIKKYEKERIIRKYKTVINWEKAGVESVFALIDVKVTPVRDKGYDAVAERIMRFPEVRALYLVSGAYDLSVLVEGRTMKEVASFVAEKLAPLEQVQGTVTHFILKRYKEDGEILFGKEEKKRLAVSP